MTLSAPPTMGDTITAFEPIENDTLTLVCPASSLASKITWLKNGAPITTSATVQVIEKDAFVEEKTHFLALLQRPKTAHNESTIRAQLHLHMQSK